MKKIHFSVVNLSLYHEKVLSNPEINISDEFTFFDVIALLDQRYWEEIKPNLTSNEEKRILLFGNCETLLQILWNPKTNETYKDVMIEARECFSSRTKLPVLDDFNFNLPDNAYFAVGPDQG